VNSRANVAQQQSPDRFSESPGFSFVMALSTNTFTGSLILDSGASEHLINKLSVFDQVTDLDVPVKIN